MRYLFNLILFTLVSTTILAQTGYSVDNEQDIEAMKKLSRQELFERAQKNFKLERFRNAISVCQIILEKDPQDERALYLKQLSYYKQNRYQHSLEDLDSVLHLEITDLRRYARAEFKAGDFFDLRGRSLTALKRYEEAIEAFDKALLFSPNPYYFNGRASVYLAMGRPELAYTDIIRAYNLAPDDVTTFHNLALYYTQIGESFTAVQNFNRALKLEPTPSLYHDKWLACYAAQDVSFRPVEFRKMRDGGDELNRRASYLELFQLLLYGDYVRAKTSYQALPKLPEDQSDVLQSDFVEYYLRACCLYLGNGRPREALGLLVWALKNAAPTDENLQKDQLLIGLKRNAWIAAGDAATQAGLFKLAKSYYSNAMPKGQLGSLLSARMETLNKQTELVHNNQVTSKRPVASFAAIYIGCDDYSGYANLTGSIKTCRQLESFLRSEYGFQTLDTVYNPSRLELLRKLKASLSAQPKADNLVIFFSGHGALKATTRAQSGWIACDGKTDADLILSEDISKLLNSGSFKRVLVISDACFSGNFNLVRAAGSSIQTLQVLSSSSNGEVSEDSGFIKSLIIALNENQSDELSTGKLLPQLKQDLEDMHTFLGAKKADPRLYYSKGTPGEFIFQRNIQ